LVKSDKKKEAKKQKIISKTTKTSLCYSLFKEPTPREFVSQLRKKLKSQPKRKMP